MARRPVSLSIEGVDGVADVLGNLGPREARNLLRSAIHGVAAKVREEIRARAPRDEGILSRAIVAKRERIQGDRVASNVTITHGHGVKNDAYYWHFIEYGTVKMRARPFVRPAVEAMRPQLQGVFEREFRAKFERMMQRKLRAAVKK